MGGEEGVQGFRGGGGFSRQEGVRGVHGGRGGGEEGSNGEFSKGRCSKRRGGSPRKGVHSRGKVGKVESVPQKEGGGEEGDAGVGCTCRPFPLFFGQFQKLSFNF